MYPFEFTLSQIMFFYKITTFFSISFILFLFMMKESKGESEKDIAKRKKLWAWRMFGIVCVLLYAIVGRHLMELWDFDIPAHFTF